MKKLFILVLTLSFCIGYCTINGSSVYATENYSVGESTFNIKEMEVGKSYVLYENKEEQYKIVVDFLETQQITLSDPHDSGWSSGTIPGPSRTLYPHVVGGAFDGTGFYEDVKITGGVEIVDVYNEDVNNPSYYAISNVSCNIIDGKATSSRPAKASLTFKTKYLMIPDGFNSSCYLTSEINKLGQSRVSWKLP